MNHLFARIASYAAHTCGRPIAFIVAMATCIIWAATGPYFHYSDTWQLVINTSTTVITFLVVFLIQNSVNRDTLAIQLKLDELVKAVAGARNEVIAAEMLTETEIKELKEDIR